MNELEGIGVLIGRPVVSIESANKLGEVHDLVVHPITGELAGLSIQSVDDRILLIAREEIHSIGPDAVMVENDKSLVSPDESPVKAFPLAKNNLIGVKVITEDGKLLGEIANIYIHFGDISQFAYEVRSSILDKLLGHSLYFPASSGCAFSDDGSRLIVSNATEKAARRLEDVASRFFHPSNCYTPQITVRSHTD